MKKDKFYKITSYIKSIITDTEFENKVFIVGGAIRSLLMEEDIKDIDIVVELPNGGVKLVNFFKDNGYCNSTNIFETYGTAMCHLKEFHNEEIECCMTRGEKYLDNGSRNPTVKFANLKEDAFRRDLTINALYYNCLTGEIMDPTGYGLIDIENKICRTPMDSNQTFIDDPLRILRCVRFSCKLGFTISKETWNSMVKNVDRLEIISKERIQAEFNKIITDKNATKGIEDLCVIGAMKYIIPEFIKTIGMQQNDYHFGDVYIHSMSVLNYYHYKMRGNAGKPDLVTALACLLHDIGKIKTKSIKNDKIHFYDHEYVGSTMIPEILKRLKYDNDTIKEVTFLVKNHMRTKNFGDDMVKIKPKSFNKLAYECGCKERWLRLATVIECDNMSHKIEHNIKGHFTKMFASLPNATKMFEYKLPVDGDDVMRGLDLKPCKDIKLVLDRLLKMAFQNPNIDRESCLKQIKFIWKQIQNERTK